MNVAEMIAIGAATVRRHEREYIDASRIEDTRSTGKPPRGTGIEKVRKALTKTWKTGSVIAEQAGLDRIHVSVTLRRLTDRGEARRRGEPGAYEWRRA